MLDGDRARGHKSRYCNIFKVAVHGRDWVVAQFEMHVNGDSQLYNSL